MSERLLFLSGSSGVTSNTQFRVGGLLKQVGLQLTDVFFSHLYRDNPNPFMRRNRKMVLNDVGKSKAKKNLNGLIENLKPKLIIVNDIAALEIVSGGQTSLDLTRGSVYFYKGLPCIVLNSMRHIHPQVSKYGLWVALQDFKKIGRWVKGNQRFEPAFEYEVCNTIEKVRSAREVLCSCIAMAPDIETSNGFITCVGYAGLTQAGTIKSFVIPFFNPLAPSGCFWKSEQDEIETWGNVALINASRVPKIMQNGMYDSSYFVKYHIPPMEYILDTMHMFHGTWCELPKSLDFISSICLDYYRYWKAESKAVQDEKLGKTQEALDRYWRYNALDCHNTLLDCIFLLPHILRSGWAKENYVREFADAVGPAFAMSMRGIRRDVKRLAQKREKLEAESREWLGKIKQMVDDDNYNPRSPDQYSQLLYKVLGAKPVKYKGKAQTSVDKNILKHVAEQHPLFDMVIEAHNKAKEPLNNISKYCDLRMNGSRFRYALNPAGTETWRYAGKEHMFREGTNPQNIPEFMRDFLVADPGYVLFNGDYSKSDAVFMAFESGDEQFIQNVTSDKDTHVLHGAHFFKIDYTVIETGLKDKIDFYSNKVTGIRALSKRIGHGANYMMMAYTLYMTMGKKPAVAAAMALGNTDAATWSTRKLVEFCGVLLASYYTMYRKLPGYYEEIHNILKTQKRITNIFGYTRLFFGDVNNDDGILREGVAFIGQGDTAGNINRSLRKIYYESECEAEGMMLLLQVHDSIVGQVPHDKLHLIERVREIMEAKLQVNGKEFYVPADFQVGFRWGEHVMTKYVPGMSFEDVCNKCNDKPAWFENFTIENALVSNTVRISA